MNSFPELQTERLVLRKIQLSDLTDLLRLVNNKAITDQILNFPFPYLEEDAIARVNFARDGFKSGDRYVFAIAGKEDGKLRGEIGLHLDKVNNRAEMGFWIGESFWNQGFISEAVSATLRFGFRELKLRKILATHYLDNPASGKVLMKAGMVKEAELKDHYLHNGVYGSVNQYRLTVDEWEGLNQGRDTIK